MSQLLPLSKICHEAKIPLLVARSYGLIGYVRLCLPEHSVVESKPDNFQDDLRVANPFPELLEYVSTVRSQTKNNNKYDKNAKSLYCRALLL